MEGLPVKRIEKPVLSEVLSYQAPFLIDKLYKNSIVDSKDEGRQLFTELKRWMLLTRLDKTKIWPMHSLRIDEVWHQFVLFTDEYIKFCQFFFGSYIAHSPSNAPGIEDIDASLFGSFSEFGKAYYKVFDIELPEIWFDEKSVNANRRILNEDAGKLFLKDDEDGMINMINENGSILLTINSLAREAMEFIVSTKAFYVRELSGGLTDEEKNQLISTMIEFKILKVAS